jgi:phosphoserine aminotransferase
VQETFALPGRDMLYKTIKENTSVYNTPNTIARYQMTKEITQTIGRGIISVLAHSTAINANLSFRPTRIWLSHLNGLESTPRRV